MLPKGDFAGRPDKLLQMMNDDQAIFKILEALKRFGESKRQKHDS